MEPRRRRSAATAFAERYISREYHFESKETVYEVKTVFVRDASLAFSRLSNFRDSATLSMDYDTAYYTREAMRVYVSWILAGYIYEHFCGPASVASAGA